ncbi:MAG: Uma2 family endonuclease [Chloroflexi bacterium]|nr:Uma2 family endonuclease [Chloroflexota bacterium]MCI0579630.1 Uma2 family endonuclease [Chloroflexota bacterium]MCI0643565.1 Uma2 family endonuclease [Chloroflexota bacterium]MCI0726187.1 Uma2 family endonuclease [Chloroflexota bacterium]
MATVVPLQSKIQPRQTISLDEFFALPEGPPYYEFEDGELILMSRTHSRHQKVALRLGSALDAHVTSQGLGAVWPEIEVHLPAERRVYAPDLVFLAVEHLDHHNEEDGRIHGVPDLVVEILSPSTESRDRTRKLTSYQRAGVSWYWLVRPDDLGVEEYRLTPEGYLLAQTITAGQPFTPGLFPNLTLELAALMGENVGPVTEE